MAPYKLPVQYQPDPAEEAYYASPEGLRNSARLLREEAQRMVERAQAMEAEAEGLADHGVGAVPNP